MSDEQAGKYFGEDVSEVFPSLSDDVLKKLKLLGIESRERLNEEEIEQKFSTLALAFTIDSTTVQDRCERQKRYRDQTDTNLINEINKLIEKVAHIQPLCQDANTAELLTGLLAQIDVIVRASLYAAVSAEKYGAVQHEVKLSDAVGVMIKHVNLLKQQRDSTRKQLQCTKKLLQDTTSADSISMKQGILNQNGKAGGGRRASIATFSQLVENGKSNSPFSLDAKKMTRRTSDLSSRISTFMRSSRPSRLELGVDLDKIREGIVVNNLVTLGKNAEKTLIENIEETDEYVLQDSLPVSLRQRITSSLDKVANNVQATYERVAGNGSLHEMFYFASLLCFAFGIMVFVNILIELELSRINTKTLPYSYWDALLKLTFKKTAIAL